MPVQKVDWNWWFVFFPTWVVLFVQLAGFCVDFTLAKKLAAGIEGKEDDDLSEVTEGTVVYNIISPKTEQRLPAPRFND